MDGRNTGRMGFSHAAEDSAEEYDGGSQSRKNPKTSDGKYLADPLRNNGKTRDDRIYTDFVRTKLCYEILNLPGEEKLNTIEKNIHKLRRTSGRIFRGSNPEPVTLFFTKKSRNLPRVLGIREKIQISESLLSHAVLDYFTDIPA